MEIKVKLRRTKFKNSNRIKSERIYLNLTKLQEILSAKIF